MRWHRRIPYRRGHDYDTCPTEPRPGSRRAPRRRLQPVVRVVRRPRPDPEPQRLLRPLPTVLAVPAPGPRAYQAQLRKLNEGCEVTSRMLRVVRPPTASCWSTRRPRAANTPRSPASCGTASCATTRSSRPPATATADGTTNCRHATPPKPRCCDPEEEATMTITDDTMTHDTMTVETVLSGRPPAGRRRSSTARQIEAGRRVPPDLLDQLRAAGCFRLVRPTTPRRTRGVDRRRDA